MHPGILMGKSLGKCPFGRLRRCDDNIKRSFTKTGHVDGK
jgi:hypothetical protein